MKRQKKSFKVEDCQGVKCFTSVKSVTDRRGETLNYEFLWFSLSDPIRVAP
jgi:hypothetical protein